MRQECEDHYTSARDNQYRSTARYYKDTCPYCEIDRLKAELAASQQEVERLKEEIRHYEDQGLWIPERAEQAHRKGWEQAKAEAKYLSFSCSCHKTIAAMKYKEAE